MSLIKCIECNKEISDKSKECPHCGCPTSESLKVKDSIFSNYDYKCKNCSGTKYTKIENQGGVFLVCNKCGFVDEVIPRQQIQQQNIPKCPICQSTNISKISATKKATKVGLFGIFGAGDIGKTWKCNNCGSKF